MPEGAGNGSGIRERLPPGAGPAYPVPGGVHGGAEGVPGEQPGRTLRGGGGYPPGGDERRNGGLPAAAGRQVHPHPARAPANAGAGAGGGGNVGDVRRRAWRSAEQPAQARCVCQVRRPQPGVADDDPVGGTLAGGLPDGEDTVPGLGEESPGVRAGERA